MRSRHAGILLQLQFVGMAGLAVTKLVAITRRTDARVIGAHSSLRNRPPAAVRLALLAALGRRTLAGATARLPGGGIYDGCKLLFC